MFSFNLKFNNQYQITFLIFLFLILIFDLVKILNHLMHLKHDLNHLKLFHPLKMDFHHQNQCLEIEDILI